MNELALSQSISIENKQYKGVPVVSFRDIDALHRKPEGSARKRFKDNRKHFIEGEDFFRVTANQLSEIRTVGINSNNGGILLTQTGYLMIVKSFTDELSWAIQRELVNGYFSGKKRGLRFMNRQVITLREYCAATGEKPDTARDRLWRRINDFSFGEALLLEGAALSLFKKTNPEYRTTARALWILTPEGAQKLKALASLPRIGK